MPAERYYTANELKKDGDIELDGLEFHHLVNVMRSKTGESVELVNGKGFLAMATIDRIEKKKAICSISEVIFEEKPLHHVILAQAIPRLNRLDFIVEKGTELGMTELWLFPGERSERKEFSETQQERLNNVNIAALKQCGRLYLPSIVVKPAIEKWSALPFPLYYGDVSPTAPLLIDLLHKIDDPNCIFVTGPESGLSNKEEAILKGLGAKGVKLHKNILRTDTASLAALTIITHRL